MADVQSILGPAALVLMLLLAAIEDLRRRRIPNSLVLSGLVAALSLAVLGGGWQALLMSSAGALLGLVLFLPGYLLRTMGAGDVKLMAAVGAFLGPAGALLALACTLVAGGIIALGWMAWRIFADAAAAGRAAGYVLLTWQGTIGAARRERFPYAVAIAAGTCVALWLRAR